jgi:NTE family protein
LRATDGVADQIIHHRHERADWPRRIFRNAEITADVLLASACLPTMFRAVEIDGEPYWDGGFTGNPTITPLIRETDAHDSILVQINPRERSDTPRTAPDFPSIHR